MRNYVSTEAGKNIVSSIDKGVLQYHENIKYNVKYISTIVDLISKAGGLGNEMRAELNAANISEASQVAYHFNQCRFYLTGYIAYSDVKYVKLGKESLQKAGMYAEESRFTGGLNVVKKYQELIAILEETVQKQAELDEIMVPLGASITAEFDKLQDLSDKSHEVSKAESIAFMLIFTLCTLIFGLLIAWVITKYFTSMIGRGVALARTYASGDLEVVVPEEDLKIKDELGDLARSMVEMGGKLKEVVSNILAGSENVSIASAQISTTTQQLSQGASEQAASTEQVSSSMEEMLSSIQQNSSNAAQTNKIARQSAEGITALSKASNESLNSVREIANKINIINDIAFQTNILALNAAVEAARAGEHGRGFAVVAAEVRKLAERSKFAANEIVDLSSSSLKATEETVKKMNAIIPEIQKTATLIEEISASSNEQKTSSEQINNAVQQLSQVTQQNAAASEEIATSTEELASQADQLRDIVSYFKINKVDHAEKRVFKTPPVPKKVEGTKEVVQLLNMQDVKEYENYI